MELQSPIDVTTLFEPTRSPAFLHRKGPAVVLGDPCNKKLCFTSCDQQLLAWHLYQLSLRPDCYVVKFGALLLVDPCCSGRRLGALQVPSSVVLHGSRRRLHFSVSRAL
jgi:hypothetical protein